MAERRIIHVDMDAFYASIEQRDNPALKGKPVIIGGRPNHRGVVSTASYEARRFGIHSAMSLTEAYKRCTCGIFLPVNMSKYREVSLKIHEIFKAFSPKIEAISLDEAFLDVTGCEKIFGLAEKIGEKIKKEILEQLSLTASVGIAPNKFLAKLASDLNKPDGFFIVIPDNISEVLEPLPVGRIWGVGAKTNDKLKLLGIKTVGQLREMPLPILVQYFGSTGGRHLHQLAWGIDDRPVEAEREAKSMGREITFPRDETDRDVLESVLLNLAESVGYRLRLNGLKGQMLSLKLRFDDFSTFTRNYTFKAATDLDMAIYNAAKQLFVSLWEGKRPIRLIGLTVAGLSTADYGQLAVFDDEEQEKQRLTKAIDTIKGKYGFNSIGRAGALRYLNSKSKRL